MKNLFDFVTLDIETTGLDFQEDEIIELGAVKYLSGEEKDRFSIFIKPQKKIPLFIKQLTHISDEQLAAGDAPTSALKKLQEFCEDSLLVCHNQSFDIGFINTRREAYGQPPISNPVLDTLELSRIFLPFLDNHKLSTLAEHYGIKMENAHRAIYDAETTGRVLLHLLKYIDSYINLQLNNTLLQIAEYAGHSLIWFLERLVSYQRQTALLKKNPPIPYPVGENYLAYKPKKNRIYELKQVFGDGGEFQKKFPHYEFRQGQLDMAEAVQDSLQKDEFLLVEAGTGVGKSLAYLLPGITFSNLSGNKLIISTNTKNLQEQLFNKDLPAIRDCLDLPFTVTLLKGRGNYLCQKKWEENLLDVTTSFSREEAQALLYLIVWKNFTRTGEISENSSFSIKRYGYIWKRLQADRHFCRGKKCQSYSQCYLMEVRKKAESSNLVIINHHLLLADMMADNPALGNYEYLVIDEAHNLPQLAPGELGCSLSYADFSNFFQQLFTIRNKFQSGLLPVLKTATTKSRFAQQDKMLSHIESSIKLISDNKDLFSDFFSKVGNLVEKSGNYGKLRVRDPEDFHFITEFLGKIILYWENLSNQIMTIKDILTLVNKELFVQHEEHLENLESVLQRLSEFHATLMNLYNPDLKDYAFWLEKINTSDENYPAGVFNYAPLHVNQLMNDKLFSKVRSVIFTSATLAIRQVFKYYSSRMGLDLLEPGFVRELIVESPFDYQKQSLVLVAGFLPEPRDKFFPAQSAELIREAIDASAAGTMILFTAYKDLNYIYEQLGEYLYQKDILLLAQDKGMSRSALLNEFKVNARAVLLGTNSFWEGIDVPGKPLELLILYRLPFLVPTEPIVEALLEKLQAEGKDSFLHYMLPNALLKYRQGFGRLIRHRNDRGLVLVLDNRIQTKQYGQFFQETIPARTVITSSSIELRDYLGLWFKSFNT